MRLPPLSTLKDHFGGLHEALRRAQRLYWVLHPSDAADVHQRLAERQEKRQAIFRGPSPYDMGPTAEVSRELDRLFGYIDGAVRVMPPTEPPDPTEAAALRRSLAEHLDD